MQDAAMNSAITAAASRLAALLVAGLKSNGTALNTIDPDHPAVTMLANRLINNYPGFSAKLGLTEPKAAGVILGEANKLELAPTAPTVVTEIGQSPPPTIFSPKEFKQ
jgi:hypothetical protein